MNKTIATIAGAAILLALVLFSTTYRVPFHEVAIVSTFGPETIVTEPGLKFKLPAPIQTVRTLDTRMQLIENRMDTVPTSDGLQIIVKTFLLWNVAKEGDGPLNFARHHVGIESARSDLEARLANATRAVLSQYRFNDLIGKNSRLSEAESTILSRLNMADDKGRTLASLGIEPRVIGVSQIVLPSQTSQTVIRRMEEERRILAEMQRQEGEAEYERIRADAAVKSDKIRAFADQLAEEIKSQGDRAAANAIGLLNEEPEFAKLLVWLDALEKTASKNSTFFIPATSLAPWHLIGGGAGNMVGVPQPGGSGIPAPLLTGPVGGSDEQSTTRTGGGN